MDARHVGDLALPREAAVAVAELEAGYGSSTNGITAHAGGGQASAVALTTRVNVIGTVATIADSVKLPAAKKDMLVVVKNAGANSANVFPASGETINALAADTALAVAAAAAQIFVCAVDGAWQSIV